MGQPIEVTDVILLDDVLVLDTDRAVTGQDGEGFTRDDEASGTFPADLAARILEADAAVDHVFVASAQVVVRRPDGWDDASITTTRDLVSRFFVFYDG